MLNKTDNELALINGNIVTVDNTFSLQQAIAIKNDRIMAVGSNEQIKPLVSRRARVIDLKGATVLPGINDSHTHTALWGGTRPPLMIDVSYPAVKSIQDIVAAVAEKARTARPGEWIRGSGWDEGFLEECSRDKNRHPSKWDLDPVSPDNPVCLGDFSVHSLWVNSRALTVASITPDTPVPTGGEIVRDPVTGELTGIIREFAAQGLIMRVIPPWTKLEKRAGIVNALKELNSLGITSLTEGALGPGGDTYQGGLLGSECISVYNDLYNENQLNVRVNFLYLFGEYGACSLRDFQQIVPQIGIHSGFGNEWLKLGGIKIFADGIPPTRTAWMSAEYRDGSHGSLVVPGQTEAERCAELSNMIRFAHHHGFQVGVHALGDRAIEATLNGFIQAEAAEPKALRHYLMHADFITPAQARRAARHNIGLSAQPALQWTVTDYMMDVVGPQKAAEQWPYRLAIDSGMHVSGSSDTPCTYPSWLQAVQCAILRESKATGKVISPDQRITREQAIRMYTIEGAWQDRMEHWKGSLEAGKMADLCVLGENIMTVTAQAIKDIPVLMTVAGGRIVFDAGLL